MNLFVTYISAIPDLLGGRCNNEQRLKIVEDQCLTRNQTDEAKISPKIFRRLLSDDKHRVLYCAIPKAGSTSFMTMIANQSQMLNGTQHFDVQSPDELRSIGLKYLNEFSMQGALHRLKRYTKIIVLRHPFDRLMSAYNDKFILKRNKYNKWYNSTIETLLGGEYAPRDGQRISFEDFIQLLVEGRKKGKFRNPHWASYMSLCHPCLVKYDLILKLETFDTDRTALSPFLNEGESSVTMPHLNDKRSIKEKLFSVTQTFKTLNETLVKAVMAIYAGDFKLFGYYWDKTKGAICSSDKGQACC